MVKKKKKTDRKPHPAPARMKPARQDKAQPPVPAADASRPEVTGISRSFTHLLERTKAYLGSGKKAKA